MGALLLLVVILLVDLWPPRNECGGRACWLPEAAATSVPQVMVPELAAFGADHD